MFYAYSDLHSGGNLQTEYQTIIVQACCHSDADRLFTARLGIDPNDSACRCCGGNYGIDDGETIAELTAYNRGCIYDDSTARYVEAQDPEPYAFPYQTVAAYLARPDVLLIAGEVSR